MGVRPSMALTLSVMAGLVPAMTAFGRFGRRELERGSRCVRHQPDVVMLRLRTVQCAAPTLSQPLGPARKDVWRTEIP